MTEDEQRQITTEVFQEHKDAHTRLGCLRSKARRMARPFSGISDALHGRPQNNEDELIAGLPSKDDIKSVLEEIKAIEQEIVALEIEMKSQGFAEYITARSGRVMPAPDDD